MNGELCEGWCRSVTRTLRLVLWGTVFGMFLVLIMGALVTKTGSADGCGDTWPLCEGSLLPAWNQHALIEYGHRLVSGLVGILVVVMSVMVWKRYKHRTDIRVLIPLALFFLLLQAWLGAMAVMWPQPKAVLALHFGISLVAFASVLLPAVIVEQVHAGGTHRRQPVSPGLRRLIWLATAYVYIIVYTGAYVRHTGSDLACPDFPLCNGMILPELSGYVGIHFTHRLAAFVGVILLAGVVVAARRVREERPDIYKGAVLALIGIVLQAASGALSVLSQLALPAMMVHSGIITALFGVLSYLCLQVLPEPQALLFRPGELVRQK